ncbi:XRE family transcriptional regulator [Nocardia yunnanensis]|uniref:XRE family transcriptional regulator n=1 Tax=Nocardia yunnanensis TaxID=2382165 RepID=A0A386ZIW8_9NOCA|nr:helix-turn-helix transcriptional regulator [Nocardia yunnanensis]AYF77310.1 XRE family transcriptional regulator [Nocardia yunnanensis]
MNGATVSRRALGRFLRQIREEAGKTALAAGLEIEVSRQTLLRMEDGLATKIATSQLRDLLEYYGASEEIRAQALSLWDEVREQAKSAQQQGKAKGFWRPYADQYEAHFPHYLRLETTAHRITVHQTMLVPGLLQTSDYRRGVIRIDGPDLSAVDLERRIELTTRRQARLEEQGFQLDCLLSEAVLRHRPASAPAMAAQLSWLAEVGHRPNIRIRVVPFDAGAHRGLTAQSFTMLEFPKLQNGFVDPPVVYVEGAHGVGGVYHERDDVVRLYGRTILALTEVALTEQETRDLVTQYAKEYAA